MKSNKNTAYTNVSYVMAGTVVNIKVYGLHQHLLGLIVRSLKSNFKSAFIWRKLKEENLSEPQLWPQLHFPLYQW